MKNKLWYGMVVLLLIGTKTYGQEPRPLFFEADFDNDYYGRFSNNKRIPPQIKEQVLIALSFYPELKDTRIIFRLKRRKTPLTSRPRILSAFLPKKHRTYVVTISTNTTNALSPILFSELPYNAQIGVLGHELMHVAAYEATSSFQLIGLAFKISNSEFLDDFEFNTDKGTIAHGLGHQLLEWSRFVRKALKISTWKGASSNLAEGNDPGSRERYMHPETIIKYMSRYPIYNE